MEWDDFESREHTAAFAKGERVRAFSGFAQQASRRLDILDAASCLDDLRALASNRLESLHAIVPVFGV